MKKINRKQYSQPSLKKFGAVSKLTQGVKGSGADDTQGQA